jgi:acetyl esterase/lipase
MNRYLKLWLGVVLAASPLVSGLAQQKKAPEVRIPDNVVLEADIEYGRAGDRSLKLDLLRPRDQGDKVLPVVVAIHGGGWQNGSKESFRGVPAAMAASGNYVGISVGYRLTGEAIWPAQIHDCKAAIRWVRANAARYKMDEKRIGVTGNSAGGHLVALLGTSGDVKELEGDCGNPGHSSRVACVVDFCGPSNFLTFLEQRGAGGRSAVIKLFGGPPSSHPEAARAASPVTWASADDPPFLIFHGTEDMTVPFAQGEAMSAALQKAGTSVTFVRVEGGGHGLQGRETNQRRRDFFERHLRGQNVDIPATPIAAEAKPKKG